MKFLAGLAVLLLQDQAPVDAFLEFCKKPKPETADNAKSWIRRSLDQQNKDSAMWQAFYLVTCFAGDKGNLVPADALKRLGEHLEKAAGKKPDAAAHLAFADALSADKADAVRWVALGHLADAVAGGAAADEAAKKLGLVQLEGAWATPHFVVLARMKALAPADAVGVGTNPDFAKEDSVAIRYFRMVCLLRAIEKNLSLHKDLEKVFGQLRGDPFAKEQVDALRKQIDIYLDCSICRKSRESTCGACNGKGERELVCLFCKGTGISEKTVVGNTTHIKGCPTCLNMPERTKRTEKCGYCLGRGKVACERCKFMIPKYEDIVKEAPCARCDNAGSAFKHVKAACPFCLGLGVVLRPSGAPDKRAGPPE
jgi:hypothetical protein